MHVSVDPIWILVQNLWFLHNVHSTSEHNTWYIIHNNSHVLHIRQLLKLTWYLSASFINPSNWCANNRSFSSLYIKYCLNLDCNDFFTDCFCACKNDCKVIYKIKIQTYTKVTIVKHRHKITTQNNIKYKITHLNHIQKPTLIAKSTSSSRT